MGYGGETGLERARCQVDAAFEHQMEEALEAIGIAGHDVGEGHDVIGAAEIQTEHAADLGGDEGDASGIGAVLQALQHTAGVGAQFVMEAGAADQAQRGQARGHRQWIARQGAGLVDRAKRRDVLHDGALAAKAADRHAAADDLAERRQVRSHAVVGLGAAEGDAETGHHFVEDQHHAIRVTQGAQAFEEAWCRGNAVHVAGDRLDDDAGDLLAFFLQRGFDFC